MTAIAITEMERHHFGVQVEEGNIVTSCRVQLSEDFVDDLQLSDIEAFAPFSSRHSQPVRVRIVPYEVVGRVAARCPAGSRISEVAMRRWQSAEDAVMSLLPRGARQGTTWFGRTGDIVQQPPVWAALAGALAWGGGDRGRRAALRGTACYGATAIVGNLIIKPLVARPRPPGSGENRTGPVTSSFPSGHAASDLAFTLAASQEIPALFVALAPATMAAHWSLVRSRGHYPSDVFAGGVLVVAVVLIAWKIWPLGPPAERENSDNNNQERPMSPRARPTSGSTL